MGAQNRSPTWNVLYTEFGSFLERRDYLKKDCCFSCSMSSSLFSELSCRASAQARFLPGEPSMAQPFYAFMELVCATPVTENNATITPLHKYLSISEESHGRETEKV